MATTTWSRKPIPVPHATSERNTDSYRIDTITCKRGERVSGMIPIGPGTAGEELGIPVIVIHGAFAGPVLAVQAGVHGDEYDGMQAVRVLVEEIDASTLHGTLVAIPCVNLTAFETGTRVSGVDYANLNRIFPGSATGSFSMRLAATYVEKIVPAIDALVDLHTGGAFGQIVPLTIVQRGYEELATALGLAAGHELLWKGGAWGGTARIAALEAGKPAVTIEVGGGSYQEENFLLHLNSLRNIVRYLGMVDGEAKLRESYNEVNATFGSAKAGGFYVAKTVLGQKCKAGDEIAQIVGHLGEVRERILAPDDGVVVWLRRRCSIHIGDETVIFGPLENEIAVA